jgi:uncharacterized Zn ribbon protein
MSTLKNKELTKESKLRIILQEFKEIPWSCGLERLDYTRSLEDLRINANRIMDELKNFEFTVGDCVTRVKDLRKKGTVVQINAGSITRGIKDVVVLWESNDSERHIEEVNSSEILEVFFPIKL